MKKHIIFLALLATTTIPITGIPPHINILTEYTSFSDDTLPPWKQIEISQINAPKDLSIKELTLIYANRNNQINYGLGTIIPLYSQSVSLDLSLQTAIAQTATFLPNYTVGITLSKALAPFYTWGTLEVREYTQNALTNLNIGSEWYLADQSIIIVQGGASIISGQDPTLHYSAKFQMKLLPYLNIEVGTSRYTEYELEKFDAIAETFGGGKHPNRCH
jgi:hypothetical protein